MAFGSGEFLAEEARPQPIALSLNLIAMTNARDISGSPRREPARRVRAAVACEKYVFINIASKNKRWVLTSTLPEKHIIFCGEYRPVSGGNRRQAVSLICRLKCHHGENLSGKIHGGERHEEIAIMARIL